MCTSVVVVFSVIRVLVEGGEAKQNQRHGEQGVCDQGVTGDEIVEEEEEELIDEKVDSSKKTRRAKVTPLNGEYV